MREREREEKKETELRKEKRVGLCFVEVSSLCFVCLIEQTIEFITFNPVFRKGN
jgi:hypothetical protein